MDKLKYHLGIIAHESQYYYIPFREKCYSWESAFRIHLIMWKYIPDYTCFPEKMQILIIALKNMHARTLTQNDREGYFIPGGIKNRN